MTTMRHDDDDADFDGNEAAQASQGRAQNRELDTATRRDVCVYPLCVSSARFCAA